MTDTDSDNLFLLDPLKSKKSASKCCSMSRNKKISIITVAIIGTVFLTGLAALVLYMECNMTTTSFKYCLCNRYTYKTEEIQTCDININNEDNKMNCTTDIGYWHCTDVGYCGDKR